MCLKPKCKTGHCKTLRVNHRTLSEKNLSKLFLDPPPKVMNIKKNGIYLNLNPLYSKRNHKENKKPSLRIRENICKQRN